MPATESVTGIFLFYLNAEQQKMFAPVFVTFWR